MAISNYTELKAAIASWISRTDLTASIPDYITLYEADANRRIRIRQNTYTTQLTLTSGSSSVTLPTGFLEDIELNYADTAETLTEAPFDLLDREQTTDSTAKRPAYFAIDSGTIIFETEADQNYTLNLRYYKQWDIATDTTNWLLTNAPDAYLFGSLAEAALQTRDDVLLQIAISRRDASTDWVLKADSRTKSSILMVDPALRAGTTFDIMRG